MLENAIYIMNLFDKLIDTVENKPEEKKIIEAIKKRTISAYIFKPLFLSIIARNRQGNYILGLLFGTESVLNDTESEITIGDSFIDKIKNKLEKK